VNLCDRKNWKQMAMAALGAARIRSNVFCLVFCLVLAGLAATPERAAAQTETVLYEFCSLPYCADGTTPTPILTMDGEGNLYGTAAGGNSRAYAGVVFEVNTKGEESVPYDFTLFSDGVAPNGGLARDASGDFYGATAGGGYDGSKCHRYYGCGVVYKLSNGVEQVLYTFQGGADGLEPNGGLILDKSGNVYGTTYKGGGAGKGKTGPGTVYKVSPSGSKTVLHEFGSDGTDGRLPTSGLIMDTKGNVYGTTSEGGVDGYYGSG